MSQSHREPENEEPELPIVRDSYPVAAQLVVGFFIGVLLSPYSTGIVYVIAFFVVYELLIYVITEGKPPYWNFYDRLGIVCAYLLGWVSGRALNGSVDIFAQFPNEIRSPELQANDPFGIKEDLNIITVRKTRIPKD